jgi:hypothetical protein
MAIKQYLSTVIGTGSIEDPYRAAWRDILTEPYPDRHGQAIDSDRFFFWIGRLDTNDTQHDALVADNRVRYAPAAILLSTFGSLTAPQKASIEEIYTWLGLRPASDTFATTAIVEELLFNLVGHICWHPVAT